MLGELDDDIETFYKGVRIILIKKTSRLRYQLGVSMADITYSAGEISSVKFPEGEYSILNRNSDIVLTFIKSNETTIRLVDIKAINISNGRLFRSSKPNIQGSIEAFYFREYHNGNRVYLNEEVFGKIRKSVFNPSIIEFGSTVYQDGQYTEELDEEHVIEFLVEGNDILVLDVIKPDLEIVGVFSESKTNREVV